MLVVSVLAFEKSLSENKNMQQNLDCYGRMQALIEYLEK